MKWLKERKMQDIFITHDCEVIDSGTRVMLFAVAASSNSMKVDTVDPSIGGLDVGTIPPAVLELVRPSRAKCRTVQGRPWDTWVLDITGVLTVDAVVQFFPSGIWCRRLSYSQVSRHLQVETHRGWLLHLSGHICCLLRWLPRTSGHQAGLGFFRSTQVQDVRVDRDQREVLESGEAPTPGTDEPWRLPPVQGIGRDA